MWQVTCGKLHANFSRLMLLLEYLNHIVVPSIVVRICSFDYTRECATWFKCVQNIVNYCYSYLDGRAVVRTATCSILVSYDVNYRIIMLYYMYYV